MLQLIVYSSAKGQKETQLACQQYSGLCCCCNFCTSVNSDKGRSSKPEEALQTASNDGCLPCHSIRVNVQPSKYKRCLGSSFTGSLEATNKPPKACAVCV